MKRVDSRIVQTINTVRARITQINEVIMMREASFRAHITYHIVGNSITELFPWGVNLMSYDKG